MLTNWYIRNTRDRFWNEDTNAFNTLYTVLEVFMRVLAPLAPMESESVWRGLTGGESVHLADWPYVSDEKTGEATELGRVLVDDPALVDAMEKVREIVSGTLSLRKAAKILCASRSPSSPSWSRMWTPSRRTTKFSSQSLI